jgi:hypothetical protein
METTLWRVLTVAVLLLPATACWHDDEKGDDLPAGAKLWSDPANWPGGVKPAAGAAVTIATGDHFILDEDTPALGGLTILGTLEFAREDLALTADWIMLHGTLTVGTEAEPFAQRAVITLAADDPAENVMNMGTRGLLVMGGTLDLHGTPPVVAWTKLSDHLAAGADGMNTLDLTAWEPGDELVIAPTGFLGAGETERVTLTQNIGTFLRFSPAVATARWGRTQHVLASGMSEAPGTLVTPPATPTPLVLDERAEVGNLTRNIVIQAPDDALWQNDGFGAHVMVMELASTVRIDAVEFRRGGQRGVLGRYPLHWHRLSYPDGQNFIDDATGHYIRNSSFNVSSNRCVTLHATNGVSVTNNICYDVLGHAMFTEDAVERRNVFEDNLVLHVRRPDAADALKVHDRQGGFGGGASCYWINNPDNTLRGNVAADCAAFGFWLAFPVEPVGPSANVPIRPDRTIFGVFEDNVAHSNGAEGVMLDFVEIDDLGNTLPNRYISTTDGVDPVFPFPNKRRFALTRVTSYKNGRGGIWDRVDWPDITEAVLADNNGRFIAGAGGDGVVTRSLIVGTSLNDTPRPPPGLHGEPTAFATYHSTFDLFRNVIVNFPLVAGERSGVFSTDDYYIRPVDKGHARNPGNLWIDAHPGYRVQLHPTRRYALAGALWDPFGTWGPASRWNVFDLPYLTHGRNCSPILPSAADSGAVSCDGDPYYGIMSFTVNGVDTRFSSTFPLEVTRYDGSLAPIGSWFVETGNPSSPGLANMRHFAVSHGGIYRLAYPNPDEAARVATPYTPPAEAGFSVENMLDTDVPLFRSAVVLGVGLSGPATEVYSTAQFDYLSNTLPPTQKRVYQAMASLDAVRASDGETWWQDPATNVVWIKLRGGFVPADPDFNEFAEQNLYRAFNVRVH